jgi:uncharacterized protein YjlB
MSLESKHERASAPHVEPECHRLEPSEPFPNNPRLPVLLYRSVLRLPAHGDAALPIERRFERNDWTGGWRNGVYNYHHYHSTAHEVLGCYAGRASVQLGGPQGIVLEFARGDVLVLPAGTAHKGLESSHDFSVVGAYPRGVAYDMRRGRPEERADAERAIARVPMPRQDPVLGADGPLTRHWSLVSLTSAAAGATGAA